ncbi:MAG: DNA-formamidopyrimidine glycosylase family protein, partial [Flavisolibacter sp.]
SLQILIIMPELPDLQVFSKNLNSELAGKKLVKLTVVEDRKLKTSKAKLKKALEGSVLKKVFREGKELHFEFSNGKILGLHLMLRGNLNLFKKKNVEKHAIIELLFEDGAGLALSDYQRSAVVTLNPVIKSSPDALSKDVSYKFLKERFSKKRTKIKSFLLDQDIIRGIGNAYADEILWKAGISPFSICNKIPDDKIKKLATTIKSILTNAQKQILKKDPKIISGEVRDFLDIHNSKKVKSPTGSKILNSMMNSRITYFTKEQKLYN